MSTSSSPPTARRRAAARATGLGIVLALLCGLVAVAPAAADDRDLFREASSSPYVFMLLDTSGSMHGRFDLSSPPTSAEDPEGKLYLAKSALYQVIKNLDPEIRLGFAHFNQEGLFVRRKHWAYQRKPGQADPPWFSLLDYPAEGALNYFGFPANDPSTEDGSGAHLLGSCFADAVTGQGGPRTERVELDSYPKLGDAGANTTTMWYQNGNGIFSIIARLNSGSTWGDAEIDVDITVQRYLRVVDTLGVQLCINNSEPVTHTITFSPFRSVDQDDLVLRNAAGVMANDFIANIGVAGLGNLNSLGAQNVCNQTRQWYPNDTPATGFVDPDDESPLAYPVFEAPDVRYSGNGLCVETNGALDRGPVLPWDWARHPTSSTPAVGFETSTREEMLCRLAPNLCVGDASEYHVVTQADKDAGLYDEYEVGEPVPDFRVARYFTESRSSNQLVLDPKFADYPPITATGLTPLGGILRNLGGAAGGSDDFLDYWEPCASDATTGDRNYICRERFAILLTDGRETCEGDAEIQAAADELRTRGVRTFVVGFGEGVTAGDLQLIADRGGTGNIDLGVGGDPADGVTDCEELSARIDDPTFDLCPGPILAGNKQDLITALEFIFQITAGEAASIASAAAPAAQVNAQDSIFLTEFLPLDSIVPWPGSLEHYIRPLPLRTVNGNQVPDDTKRCNASREASCLAWEANESMLGARSGTYDQVPDLADLNTTAMLDRGALKIGTQTTQRRLTYGKVLADPDAVGYQPPYFEESADDNELASLMFDLGILATADASAITDASRLQLQDILKLTYAAKEAANPLATGPPTLNYIVGDIFHSDPTYLGEPGNADYLQGNLPSGATNDCDDLRSKSYLCFFLRHQQRRKVLFAGANDGQLHAFDAGTFDSVVEDDRQVGEFNFGTGQELFSFIPNAMLRRVREMSEDRTTHHFGVDGRLRTADVYIDPVHNGTPTANDRMWRTIVMGSLREGGETTERLSSAGAARPADTTSGVDYEIPAYPSYFALDVTQPDKLIKAPNETLADGGAWVPDTNNYVPSCVSAYNATDCGPLPFGSVLWEFYDRAYLDNTGAVIDDRHQADEDPDDGLGGFGYADLAPTWSRPTIGRVQVETAAGDLEYRFVAIFGGGLDKSLPMDRGNWLYMLDVETGELIYKRRLEGAAPSAPAAVDTDGDALIDTVYIGTVAGFLYKVDLSDAGVLNGTTGRVQATDWIAFKVFDTGGRAIFHPPSVVFVPREDRYAVSFGVGWRADLWDASSFDTVGRFYTLLDPGWETGVGFVVRDEDDYLLIDEDDTTERDNLLSITNPPTGKEPGWILTLEPGEKLLANPFTLGGVTVFSTYIPEELPTTTTGISCERAGESRIFTVFTTDANALISDRYRTLPGLVSNPFTEVSSLQGRGGYGEDTDGDGVPDEDAGTLPDDLANIRDAIRDLFPDTCRFNNVTIDIKVVRSDTGIEHIAPVPVCIQPTNWKDL